MRLRACDTEDDAAFVVSVRNDPETRKHSRRQHLLTYADLIDAPNGGIRETRIAEVDGVNVGYLHFDRLGDACELSWNIDPVHRRKGYGTQMVQASIALADRPSVVAEIKPDNVASVRIAEHCGFRFAEAHDGLLVYRKS